MTADRYVIVYRDGYVGMPMDRAASDVFVRGWLTTNCEAKRPAYRIRIREKGVPQFHQAYRPPVRLIVDRNSASGMRLDPARAYKMAGIPR